MTEYDPPTLPLLPSGIPGLDAVLRGGVPEFSFNLITGAPGAGKTTLAHQIMFANATPERPALYFTVLGESPIKMLRYQQQLGFFEVAKVDTCVHFINLSALLLEHGLAAVLEQILQQVRDIAPAIVVVDSFQAVARTVLGSQSPGGDLQDFVQRLAVHLSVAQATTFLIGEQLDDESHHSAVLTVADGIIALSQSLDQNAIVRKLQVVKSRGLDAMPGLHTFRITQAGIQVFPRISLLVPEGERVPSTRRIPSGVAGLDTLMGGGLPSGDAVLVRGPSGAGKSVLATQFIAAGVASGEPGVIMVFEEHPKEYMARAASLGMDLAQMHRDGMLRVVYLRPLDLSPDEALYEIRMAVDACGAKRVVIDSLSGFELALAATFRQDFRESIYRLVTALTGMGITVLITMEITEQSASAWLSPYAISFLADTLLLLQFGDHAGILTRSLLVQKMRNSGHSHERRQYVLTARGMVVSTTLAVSGGLSRIDATTSADGLTTQEAEVLQALIGLGESTEPVLAQQTGISDPATIQSVLARLIALGYVVCLAEAEPMTYRAVAQPQRRPL